MSYTSRFTLPLFAAGCVVALLAQDAPKPQLTARELFYSAASEPATPPAKTAPKPTPKKSTTAPVQKAAPPPTIPNGPGVMTPPHIVVGRLPMDGGTIQPVALRTTAPAPATGTALGLKYTILRRSGKDMVEVPHDTVFHTGDRIQFNVQTNGPGYLYIISQGASGTWKFMFPSAEVADGNNRVDGWHAYTMPPGSRIAFDEQTGVENVFIVFSREPENDLESMIYSLQSKPAHPAAQPQETAPKHMVNVADVSIDEATVGRLRETYSRDLIIERVDDKTPADKSDKQENAVYVVNPSGSSTSRVVADLTLVHQ